MTCQRADAAASKKWGAAGASSPAGACHPACLTAVGLSSVSPSQGPACITYQEGRVSRGVASVCCGFLAVAQPCAPGLDGSGDNYYYAHSLLPFLSCEWRGEGTAQLPKPLLCTAQCCHELVCTLCLIFSVSPWMSLAHAQHFLMPSTFVGIGMRLHTIIMGGEEPQWHWRHCLFGRRAASAAVRHCSRCSHAAPTSAMTPVSGSLRRKLGSGLEGFL